MNAWRKKVPEYKVRARTVKRQERGTGLPGLLLRSFYWRHTCWPGRSWDRWTLLNWGGRRHKRQEGGLRKRRGESEELEETHTHGLHRRTLSQDVEDKRKQSCEDQQVSSAAFLYVCVRFPSLVLLSLVLSSSLSLPHAVPPPTPPLKGWPEICVTLHAGHFCTMIPFVFAQWRVALFFSWTIKCTAGLRCHMKATMISMCSTQISVFQSFFKKLNQHKELWKTVDLPLNMKCLSPVLFTLIIPPCY